MPPLRPLPDLVLITLFKMLTPNDQMMASLTSPRCAVLVRSANRNVKSLVITEQIGLYPPSLDDIKDEINCFFLASKPAMQQLINIPGEPSFPDYPMTTTHLSKWHCLLIDSIKKIDTATTEQIVNIFSAVTDLKFIVRFGERLFPLLQHPIWQNQLTNLMVDWIESQEDLELITAINGLTTLQCLALQWASDSDIPELPILAQLKVVAFNSYHLHDFLRSFERYAPDNADLEVHLLSEDTKSLLSLSQPLYSRIVRFGRDFLDYSGDLVPRLCSQFRSLTSISINKIGVTDVVPLFTVLSQLHQLVHLGLWLEWKSDQELPPARPLAQLNSLRALELYLSITSHSEVQWLNLPVRMPNLQTIYIEKFYCRNCKVQFDYDFHPPDWFILASSPTLNCFQSSLFKLHSGVPMNRLILHSFEECVAAEKLLLHSANKQPVFTGQR